MLAYYYNNAVAHNKEVVVSYKSHDLPPGAGLLGLELGQEPDLTYYEWITDTSIDDGQGWGYVKGLGFKSVNNLVDNLVDRVSKNGYLLLNVGPKPDGTIPEEVKERLLGYGKMAPDKTVMRYMVLHPGYFRGGSHQDKENQHSDSTSRMIWFIRERISGSL